MKICICGGGSLGHVCAGVLGSQKDVELNLLTGHPSSWGNNVTVTDLDGQQFVARFHRISSNPIDVVIGQDIILLCLPGYLIEHTLRSIQPYVGNAVIGSVVSSTGFFFFAHDILGKNAKLFGFQRVPFIARVVEYGKSASLLGYKSSLAVALEHVENRKAFINEIERLFLTPVSILNNYLEVALSNSNPILHTGRLYSMFYGRESFIFDHNILFYKEWTDGASQLLIDMDVEFFNLLGILGVKSLPTLLDYYESTDASSLTRKITSIPAFQNITSPMIEVKNGWRVDFKSRYFTEDFPFGLRWIKVLAIANKINTPTIDRVYNWGMSRI